MPSTIIIVVACIVGLILLMRWITPKLSPSEQYLFYEVQRKSPQTDNLRLVMWVKMIVHPVTSDSDLEYQSHYLDDPEQIKAITGQMSGFGGSLLFPLFGYEAITWKLDPFKENPLFLRMAAIAVIRRYPRTAEAIEELIAHSPDQATEKYIEHQKSLEISIPQCRLRYAFNLYKILTLMTTTSRNDWWPGTNPDIRGWAEYALTRLPKAFPEVDFSALSTTETQVSQD